MPDHIVAHAVKSLLAQHGSWRHPQHTHLAKCTKSPLAHVMTRQVQFLQGRWVWLEQHVGQVADAVVFLKVVVSQAVIRGGSEAKQ